MTAVTKEQLKAAATGTRVRYDGDTPQFVGLTWVKVDPPTSRGPWLREQPGDRDLQIGCDASTLARIGVVTCDD